MTNVFEWSNDLKRFIRYLYEYEKDKRIRNVGFIKIETGCEETIVHLQAKGFHSREERNLVLYLFYEEKDRFVGISGGQMSLTSPVFSWNYSFSQDDVGGQENYSKISGVLIETGNGRRMAATWDDRCVDVSRLEEFVPDERIIEPVVDGECVECDPEVQEEEPAFDEIREKDETREKCTKISRQNISMLPKCEWKLANNKFLIHGYYNFHHLLLIDNGNNLKLGVPGIYHIKEAECAKIFGFEEFVPAKELEVSGDFNDNQDELFGYWCRPVKRRYKRQE